MLNATEKLELIRNLAEKHQISSYEIGENTSVSSKTAYNILHSDEIKPRPKTLNTILEYLENAIVGTETKLEINRTKPETRNLTKDEDIVQRGVPYYDLDVSAHITSSFNDIEAQPSFYVDFEPFNDCDGWLNVFGDSMYPAYKNGERFAVKQVFNLEVILWGEAYFVVTNEAANDLKTIKLLHAHHDESKVILRSSNPSFKGDTVINKADILALFIVKGKVSQNFM